MAVQGHPSSISVTTECKYATSYQLSITTLVFYCRLTHFTRNLSIFRLEYCRAWGFERRLWAYPYNQPNPTYMTGASQRHKRTDISVAIPRDALYIRQLLLYTTHCRNHTNSYFTIQKYEDCMIINSQFRTHFPTNSSLRKTALFWISVTRSYLKCYALQNP